MMTSLNLAPCPELPDERLWFPRPLLLDKLKYSDLEMKKIMSLQFLLSLVGEDSLLHWRMMQLKLLLLWQTLKSQPNRRILFLTKEFLKNVRNSFLSLPNLLDLPAMTQALTLTLSQLSLLFLLNLPNDQPLSPVKPILNQSITTFIKTQTGVGTSVGWEPGYFS